MKPTDTPEGAIQFMNRIETRLDTMDKKNDQRGDKQEEFNAKQEEFNKEVIKRLDRIENTPTMKKELQESNK